MLERYGGTLPRFDGPGSDRCTPDDPAAVLVGGQVDAPRRGRHAGRRRAPRPGCAGRRAAVVRGRRPPPGRSPLEHLLAMRDGLAFFEEYEDPEDVRRHPDAVRDGVRRTWRRSPPTGPWPPPPGTRFNYSTGTSMVVSGIVARTLGAGRPRTAAFLADRLFGPLGMTSATAGLRRRRLVGGRLLRARHGPRLRPVRPALPARRHLGRPAPAARGLGRRRAHAPLGRPRRRPPLRRPLVDPGRAARHVLGRRPRGPVHRRLSGPRPGPGPPGPDRRRALARWCGPGGTRSSAPSPPGPARRVDVRCGAVGVASYGGHCEQVPPVHDHLHEVHTVEDVLALVREHGGRVTSYAAAPARGAVRRSGPPDGRGAGRDGPGRAPPTSRCPPSTATSTSSRSWASSSTPTSGHGPATYHLAEGAHCHFVCQDCGTAVEAPDELFVGLAEAARGPLRLRDRHPALRHPRPVCRLPGGGRRHDRPRERRRPHRPSGTDLRATLPAAAGGAAAVVGPGPPPLRRAVERRRADDHLLPGPAGVPPGRAVREPRLPGLDPLLLRHRQRQLPGLLRLPRTRPRRVRRGARRAPPHRHQRDAASSSSGWWPRSAPPASRSTWSTATRPTSPARTASGSSCSATRSHDMYGTVVGP